MVNGIAVLVGISYVCAPPLPVYQLNSFCFVLLLDTVKKLQRNGPASSPTGTQNLFVISAPFGARPLEH